MTKKLTTADKQQAHQKSPRRGGIRLGSIAGVEFHMDWSLLLIFGVILLSLAMAAFPQWHPNWSPAAHWGVAFVAAVLFFVSVATHELSHALVARARGIPVRRITLFVFGGMAHMEKEPPSPKDELLMAGVGPLVSIAIGLLATGAGMLLAGPAVTGNIETSAQAAFQAMGPGTTLLLWLGPINLMLGIFNMVPGFPLDGGRVLRAALWWTSGNIEKATRRASAAGQAVAWTLMVMGIAMAFGFSVPIFGSGVFSGLWLVLIGWFLSNAARASYQQLLVQQRLAEVRVGDLMRYQVTTVRPDTSIESVLRDHLLRTQQRFVPVIGDNAEILGLVGPENLRSIPRDRWNEVQAHDVMTPASQVDTISPDGDAADALRHLRSTSQSEIPVVLNERLVGFVGLDDIARYLSLPMGSHA
ncbi:MAG: site-2 protease family protein [Myxococcota bacterium]